MINVSQEWIDAQKLQVRPESDVIISKGSSIVLNKKDLYSFRYTQNGKLDNSVLPTKEVYFETFDRNIGFYENDIVQVYFAYFINGSFEQAFVGNFLIVKVEKPANGLISKFTLTDNYTTPNCNSGIVPLSAQYLGGSCYEKTETTTSSRYNFKSLFERIGGNSSEIVEMPYYLAFSNLGIATYGVALQTLAILRGFTLLPVHKLINTKHISYGVANFTLQDYEIKSFIQYKKPEIIEESKISKYVVELTEMDRTIGNEEDTIYNVVIDPNDSYEITIEPDKYLQIGLSTYPSPYYAKIEENKAIIGNMSGTTWTGDITLYKRRKTANVEVFEKSTGLSGSEVRITNNLLSCADWNSISMKNDVDDAVDYALGVLVEWAKYSNSIEIECRIDPRIELFDNIKIQIGDDLVSGIAENIVIEYNGAFKGKMTCRKYKSFLNKPAISISGTILTINAVPNAERYEIYIDGVVAKTISDLTYDLEELELGIGTYEVSVVATAQQAYDSEESNIVSYIQNKLATPTLNIDGEIITTTIDDYTETIEIYLDDEKVGEVSVGDNNNE